MSDFKSLLKELDLPRDFIFQISSLFISILIIHTIYLLFIDPAASKEVIEAANQNRAPERTLGVILKDFEQEACIILFCWAMSIIFLKWQQVSKQLAYLRDDFIDKLFLNKVNRDQAKDIITKIEEWDSNSSDTNLIADSLWSGLNSFIATNDVLDAKNSCQSVCDNQAMRIESELSMIKYIIWAIPSVGFIGTVRGIGEALSQAHIAVEGNIATMTASLGVAFNSTFVALVVSIFLMFFLHQLQLLQDRLITGANDRCHKKLLSRLSIEG